MSKYQSIGVLGCGNMAQALTLGWKDSLNLKHFTYTPSVNRAKALAEKLDGKCIEKLENFPNCDVYLLACKPQQIEGLAKEFKEKVSHESLLISILAGTTTDKISELFGTNKVLRVMPNTPVMVGEGVNALYFSRAFDEIERSFWKGVFSSFSYAPVFQSENEIDIITGVSGSGPAYFFEMARIMSKKLISQGIDEEIALEMSKRTIYGAGKLLVESKDSPERLRDNVTSKKGVTFEALEIFKSHHLEETFFKALDAAYKRSVELSK